MYQNAVHLTMSTRGRTALAAIFVVALASAGCLGFLTGSEPLRFSANETVPSDDALAETDYAEAGNQSLERVFNVSLGGQTRSVDTTSYLFTYNRSIPVEALTNESVPDGDVATPTAEGAAENVSMNVSGANPSARFAVFATPDASVAGQSVNPLASLSARQLVQRFLGVGENADLTFQGNRTVQSLGASRTVETYRAQPGESETAVRFHVSRFSYDGDVVVAIAVHPASVEEGDRVDTLLAGLEQPEN
jgi:hypothetical protein